MLTLNAFSRTTLDQMDVMRRQFTTGCTTMHALVESAKRNSVLLDDTVLTVISDFINLSQKMSYAEMERAIPKTVEALYNQLLEGNHLMRIDTLQRAQEMAKINQAANLDQVDFIHEEYGEFSQEVSKFRRGKGDWNKVIGEACDIMSALLVFFAKEGISMSEVEDHINAKLIRALERYKTGGEL